MAKKTAKQFSRAKIWEIATRYANTTYEYSYDYFSKEYSISKGTFYTLLEKAVVENVVSDKIVFAMRNKAAYNSKEKAGEAGEIRSRRHYEHLIKKRKTYMLSKEEAINVTIRYARSELSKTNFTAQNYLTTKLFDRTVYKAISENWVSDEIVEKLRQKSIKSNNQKSVLEFWERLLYFRNENKKNQG